MISKDKIQAALLIATDPEKAEIQILFQAVGECLKAYRKSFKPADMKAWKVAEVELENQVKTIMARAELGAGDGAPRDRQLSFANLIAVRNYLSATGWRVSKSTIYEHQKTGLLRPDAQGFFHQAEVEKYAQNHLKRLDGQSTEDPLARGKREAEVRKLLAQAEVWEQRAKNESDLFVARSTFENHLAARMAIYRQDLLTFARTSAPEIIAMVEGKETVAPALISFMVDEFEKILHRYFQNPVIN